MTQNIHAKLHLSLYHMDWGDRGNCLEAVGIVIVIWKCQYVGFCHDYYSKEKDLFLFLQFWLPTVKNISVNYVTMIKFYFKTSTWVGLTLLPPLIAHTNCNHEIQAGYWKWTGKCFKCSTVFKCKKNASKTPPVYSLDHLHHESLEWNSLIESSSLLPAPVPCSVCTWATIFIILLQCSLKQPMTEQKVVVRTNWSKCLCY